MTNRILAILICGSIILTAAGCAALPGSAGSASGNTAGGEDWASGNGNASGSAASDPPGSAPAVARNDIPVFDGSEIAGRLTISAFDYMTYGNTLESASQSFIEKYPGMDISVDIFSAMPEIQRQESADGRTFTMAVRNEDNPQERSDYANKVNTELMSGGGADILAVDVIPTAKYVESGLLENLVPYMENDPGFNRSDYRANILDAVIWKGGVWFMPMDYNYNYYTYDSTLITDGSDRFGYGSAYTAEQLMEIAIPLSDGGTMLLNIPSYSKNTGSSVWSRVLSEHWTGFVDIANKKANFTDGAFVELLNKVKGYGDDGFVPADVSGLFDREEARARFGQAPTDRYYFKPKSNMQLLTYYMSMNNTGGGFSVSYGGGAGAIEEDDEIAGIAANADGGVPFTYTHAYAINANSKNKAAAWEFIKYMLGGEMQASGAGGILRGLSLHNATRSRQIELMMSSAAAGMRGGAAFGGAGVFGRTAAEGSSQRGGNGGGAGGARNNAGSGAADGTSAAAGLYADGAVPDRSGGDSAPAGSDGGTAENTAASAGSSGGADSSTSGGQGDASAGSDASRAPNTVNAARIPDAATAEIDPEVIRQFNEATEKFSDQINTFELKDSIINDMIAAEVDYFFEGVKTAEEVAKTLQSKVELYLNE